MDYTVTSQVEYDKAAPKTGDTVYLDSDDAFQIAGDERPILVVRAEYEPTIDTWGSSSPTISTRGSSSPTIYTWGSSSPTSEMSELVGKLQALVDEYEA